MLCTSHQNVKTYLLLKAYVFIQKTYISKLYSHLSLYISTIFFLKNWVNLKSKMWFFYTKIIHSKEIRKSKKSAIFVSLIYYSIANRSVPLYRMRIRFSYNLYTKAFFQFDCKVQTQRNQCRSQLSYKSIQSVSKIFCWEISQWTSLQKLQKLSKWINIQFRIDEIVKNFQYKLIL